MVSKDKKVGVESQKITEPKFSSKKLKKVINSEIKKLIISARPIDQS
jgi:predicted nuclease of restriction endonuclease-like RecB superfamily